MSLFRLRIKVDHVATTLLVLIAAGFSHVEARPLTPPRMDTVLYGVSYYHEYMPVERLDVRLDGGADDPRQLHLEAHGPSHRRYIDAALAATVEGAGP